MNATTDKPARNAFAAASVVPAEGGFAVRIDDRPLRSPAGQAFVLPTAALAEAIADEWRAAAPHPPKPGAMPLTRIAGTALDRLMRERATIEAQLLEHAETELLCHRAAAPADLARRQHALWQPLLDWVAIRHDALLAPTTGIVARPQSPAAVAALRGALTGMNPWRLAALSVAVAASGSLVVGLALADGRIDAAGAFDAAELDATWQMEKWGEDSEALDRRATVRADLDLAARFLALLAD